MYDGLGEASIGDRLWFVPHRDMVLLHAPRRRISALVNRSAADALRVGLDKGGAVRCAPGIRGLATKIINRVPERIKYPTGKLAPKRLSLLMTNDCNLSCRYCGVMSGERTQATIDEDTCDIALEYQAEVVRREGFGSLMVYYFGGEPSGAIDMIRHCDRKGRELAGGLRVPFRSACTTNGVMPRRVATWLAKHLDYVVVSLDGPAEIHDRLRPTRGTTSSHGDVIRTLRIFEDQGLPYALRCTVDEAGVESLPNTVRFLCEELHPVVVNIEPVREIGRCSASGCRPPAPPAYVAGVVEAGRVARSLGVGIKLSMVGTERICRSFCGVADDSLVVSSDGILSGCFQIDRADSPLAARWAFGRIDPEARRMVVDVDRLGWVRHQGVESRPECFDCFSRWHCAGGCVVVDGTGSSPQKSERCSVIRALTRWRILEQLRLPDEADRVRLDGRDDVKSLVLPASLSGECEVA
jgi:uncharacterized protein